jgi:hypothetical protein
VAPTASVSRNSRRVTNARLLRVVLRASGLSKDGRALVAVLE